MNWSGCRRQPVRRFCGVERDAAQALGGELPGGIEPAAAGEGEAGLRAALHEGGDAQGGPGPAGVADDGGLVAHEAVGI
jgi:hypothetical protein